MATLIKLLAYDLCNATPNPYSQQLFIGIAEYLETYTTGLREVILEHDDVVTAYAQAFEKYDVASGIISRVCEYLNKIITQSNHSKLPAQSKRQNVGNSIYKRQTVQALALSIWKKNIFLYIRDHYNNRLIYQIFEHIRRDRDGFDAPYSALKITITSLVQLNSLTDQPLHLYIEEFERPYLVHTKRYYESEAAREMANASVSQFMTKATQRLQQESFRNYRYCHSTSHDRILRETEAQYIAAYQSVIQDDFINMLNDNRYKDCTLAYNLLLRVPNGLNPILALYETYVANRGKNILEKLGNAVSKDPKSYVELLLELHQKFYSINKETFTGNPTFTAAVDKAFRTIVNDTTVNPSANGPEILARYCDSMLKRSTGRKEVALSASSGASSRGSIRRRPVPAADDSDPTETLTRMITLFKYIDDKDVFQKFYARLLAKRLIHATSVSEEAEATMISQLKETCGIEYTSKLHRMFTDMSLSADLNLAFKSQEGDIKGFEMLVLTSGAWPLNQSTAGEFKVPEELVKCVSKFEDFYKEKHNGRRLSWLWHLSRGEIKVTYLDKPYELSVSLHQMSLVLLFNTVQSLSVKDMAGQTGLTVPEVLRSVKALVDLGIFNSSEKKVDENTELSINPSFSSKRTKIKVSTSVQADTPQENSATRKAVEEDRRIILQAAIVRVMKSRQILSHQQLVQEVIDQTRSRFAPSVPMIKKCIEQLLEKQYIDRQDRDRYVYVA
ncbi:Cullin [Umbelopsis sp. PMI_123]|nr:Cullin [Umbelopsis sp. PMI_123]